MLFCLNKCFLRILLLFDPDSLHVSRMQDSQDPLANSLLQPQCPGTLVLELDWLPSRTDKNDPLVLCIAGADSSFRLVEVNMYVPELFLSFGFFSMSLLSLYA